MSRLFYHVMQDNLGNLLFGVTGTVRLSGTGTLATIYGDEGLTVILPNPTMNHPTFGSFKFFLGAGDFDFYMAKAGYTFETLTGVQGYGTMADQEASAVAITGGSATGLALVESTVFQVFNRAGDDQLAYQGDLSNVGTNRYNLYMSGNAPNYLAGALGIGTFPAAGTTLTVTGQSEMASAHIGYLGLGGAPADALYALQHTGSAYFSASTIGLNTVPDSAFALALLGAVRFQYAKALSAGVIIQPIGADASGGAALLFKNVAGTDVGSITLTGAATAYNTASDARLKKMVEIFDGALDLVHQLSPVRFLWRADDSKGHGFLANEVQQVIDGVVTGEPDAMNEDGSINPQQMDHSKLVPLLTAAIKELSEQVQTLMARVEELELLTAS